MYRLDYSNYLMAFLICGLCEQRDYSENFIPWLRLALLSF